VSGLRVLAVRAEPPEAAPGAAVGYTALLVDGSGERADVPLDWAFCNKQKAQSDLDDVDALCFVPAADYLAPLGAGAAVSGKLPLTACSLFGPDVPPAQAGMLPGRPVDPDLTGGFYQPVRLLFALAADDYLLAAGESRLVCGLPGATPETTADFKARYRVNQSPAPAKVTAGEEDTTLAPDDGTSPAFAVKAGSALPLTASWPVCPADAACAGAEPYVAYDPVTRAVVARREAMTVSWFATAGSFATDRSGRGEEDEGTTAANTWTAPAQAGPARMWVVLRDSRGGVSWQRYRLEVQ
jgi:hypothetical protein